MINPARSNAPLFAIAARHAIAPLGVLFLSWSPISVLAAFWADVTGATIAFAVCSVEGPVRGWRGWLAAAGYVTLILGLLFPIPALLFAWVYAVARLFSSSPLTDWAMQGGIFGALLVAAMSGFDACTNARRAAADAQTRTQRLTRETLLPATTRTCVLAFVAMACYFLHARLDAKALVMLACAAAAIGFVADVLQWIRRK